MSDRVEVRYAAADGTVIVEPPITAEHSTVQLWDGGRALLKLYRDGRLAETYHYRQADRIHRVLAASRWPSAAIPAAFAAGVAVGAFAAVWAIKGHRVIDAEEDA